MTAKRWRFSEINQEEPSLVGEMVGKCLPAGTTAPISATILIGFAGRTKEKEWAENPLFSFAGIPFAQNLENSP